MNKYNLLRDDKKSNGLLIYVKWKLFKIKNLLLKYID